MIFLGKNMPFTIDGQWVPSKQEEAQNGVKTAHKPVKVRLVKRANNLLTVILNIHRSEKEIMTISSTIKKRLGCGGAVKENAIEIQGDKVEEVKRLLLEMGIKSS